MSQKADFVTFRWKMQVHCEKSTSSQQFAAWLVAHNLYTIAITDNCRKRPREAWNIIYKEHKCKDIHAQQSKNPAQPQPRKEIVRLGFQGMGTCRCESIKHSKILPLS